MTIAQAKAPPSSHIGANHYFGAQLSELGALTPTPRRDGRWSLRGASDAPTVDRSGVGDGTVGRGGRGRDSRDAGAERMTADEKQDLVAFLRTL